MRKRRSKGHDLRREVISHVCHGSTHSKHIVMINTSDTHTHSTAQHGVKHSVSVLSQIWHGAYTSRIMA